MRLLGLALESLWVAFGKVFVQCSCPGVEIWEVNWARRNVWRGVGAPGGCMTQHEKFSIDGWRDFVSILKLAGTARRLQQNIQLRKRFWSMVRVSYFVRRSPHLHRASHESTRRKELSMWSACLFYDPGLLYARDKPCTRSSKRSHRRP